MTTTLLLFLFINIPFFPVTSIILLVAFAAVIIYLLRLLRRFNKNEKLIEQSKEHLLEIQKAKEQTEKQAKEKSLFYISLIHELKIPFLLIRHSLGTYLKNKDTKQDKNLSRLKIHIDNLNRNIRNFLDAEKLGQDQLLYNHTNVLNISKAIKKEIEVFKSYTNEKEISLTLVSERSLFANINANSFERLVNNLLENAVKFTPKGGEINVSLKSDAAFIYLAVKDTGAGIPEDELKNIFKAYYKGKRDKMSFQGLGLGLFLVKSIIDSVNGRIEVMSEVNNGTTFTLVFPKYKPFKKDTVSDFTPGEPVKINDKKLKKETYDKNKHTILIVEDNMELLIFLQKSLLDDYNVYYATNGKEAINKLFHMPKPDIIISDIIMDTMSGHELFDIISDDDRYKDVPFIFITAKPDKEEKIKSLQKGIMDYICKPFLIEELLAKIKTFLRNREKIKEREIKKIR